MDTEKDTANNMIEKKCFQIEYLVLPSSLDNSLRPCEIGNLLKSLCDYRNHTRFTLPVLSSSVDPAIWTGNQYARNPNT